MRQPKKIGVEFVIGICGELCCYRPQQKPTNPRRFVARKGA